MSRHGFVRVAAMAPPLKLADPRANASATIDAMHQAADLGVDVLVGPEMGLTGYTCNDLFFQQTLQRGAIDALQAITVATARLYSGVVVVGLPVVVDDQIFNCAAFVSDGEVLGIVPKTYLPNYKEFYDARFFAPSSTAISTSVTLFGKQVPFGPDLLFSARQLDSLTIGIEICEDLWGPIPPSSIQSVHGATVLLNLSASNETIAKANYRRDLVTQQSARCIAAYVYAGAGRGESTTDIVFGGHCLIAENGTLISESPRFKRELVLQIADIDLDRLRMNRQLTTSFGDALLDSGLKREFRRIMFHLPERRAPEKLMRKVEAHPFVPSGERELKERCEEIFTIQVTGLGRRLEQIGTSAVSIGVSGGLDSTLALLVLCKTLDHLGVSREKIRAITMPGFGTTSRTLTNAKALMNRLGVSYREIDIRPLCFEEMKALGHSPFGINLHGMTHESLMEPLRHLPPEKRKDLTFENIQARVRTSLLMNTAFVIGTGDLSELALGWCTYNADHMSMYNVNVSIPKTLVKFLVRWAAENEFEGSARDTLIDIVQTEISPELLPADAAGKAQSTESSIGPYELHDFFMFHFLRYGTTPEKILYLATQAKFDAPYSLGEIRKWLRMFVTRFFGNQFKRSCLPDGPKVGSVSLSPRGDWRMPSDASAALWLENLPPE
ncbi:NAD(+) synthase [Zavarzinella formosa]|uniref:NAD(+) synthase n=1 Tax=Zavarzinella formosa TaxID=360055 RepID=UPI0002D9E42A|nr:NAD(+) synthase [Zavarzinella formosa]